MNQLSTHIETLIDNYNSCTSTFIFHTWAFLKCDEQVLFEGVVLIHYNDKCI